MTRPRLKEVSIVDMLRGSKRELRKDSTKNIIKYLENMHLDEIIFFNDLGYQLRDIQYTVRHYSVYLVESKREFMIKTVHGGWKVWRWK